MLAKSKNMPKTVNAILTVLFLLFALVQINDPDPWKWVLLYGIVALISGFAYFGIYRRWVILGGLAICLIELIGIFPDFTSWINQGMPNIAKSMKTDEPHIELTREFLGLAICIAALSYHYFRVVRKKL